MVLDIALVLFLVLESANVLILYLKPGFRHGNSMAVFDPWVEAQGEVKSRLLTTYLVRWVANCKAIFIVLLLVVLVLGSREVKLWAVGATLVSIGLYYLTLHPVISQLDRLGVITPQGYSRVLAWQIGGFMAMFALALGWELLVTGTT